MPGTEGQRSTVTDGDYICVIPSQAVPNNTIPTSGPASQARIEGMDMIYKKRAGASEGLAYPMSVIYVKTQFGNVFLLPALEQASSVVANVGKIAFVFDPTATEIVFKLRPTPKQVQQANIADEVVVRAVATVAGPDPEPCPAPAAHQAGLTELNRGANPVPRFSPSPSVHYPLRNLLSWFQRGA